MLTMNGSRSSGVEPEDLDPAKSSNVPKEIGPIIVWKQTSTSVVVIFFDYKKPPKDVGPKGGILAIRRGKKKMCTDSEP